MGKSSWENKKQRQGGTERVREGWWVGREGGREGWWLAGRQGGWVGREGDTCLHTTDDKRKRRHRR